MEIEDINHRSSKRSRVGNGKLEPRENHRDEDEGDGETKGEINNNSNSAAGGSNSNNNRMIRPWHHPSSRIIRVSRASGGKDRHSKVITAKGLRDRRVRLSVSTAIQFYDLQDRLGYDQPSKAIEWLIKAATSAIAELPSLDTNFPEAALDHHDQQQQQQQQLINIEQPMPSDSGMDHDADPSYNQQQHSSTSETSKGSVLSLSRSESRVRARERAKERVMDKKKDRDDAHVVSHHHNVADPSLNSQGSFTKLLTGGSSSTAAAVTVIAGQASSSTANFFQKQMQNLPPVTSTADYFGTQSSLFGQHLPQQKGATTHQISTSGFSSQAHFGNSSPIGMVPLISGNAGDGHPGAEMQQFAFLQDHFFPVAAAAAAPSGGDYNLNFSISPSLAGFHRGTLQSNSPAHNHQQHHQLSHHHHHHQQQQQQVQALRLSSALDGSSVPFFFGAAATAAAASPAENPYASGFEGHLQLCDGYKHLELKGKGKN